MRSLVIVLLTALLVLPACGSAHTEDKLGGVWFGPALQGGSRGMEILGGGRVIRYDKDGSPTGTTGWLKHISGNLWHFYVDDGPTALLMAHPDLNHFALLVPGDDLSVMQRDATNWAAEDFVLEDLVDRDYVGNGWFFDGNASFLDLTNAQVSFAPDGSYAGDDDRGRVFASEPGEEVDVVDPIQGAFFGSYGDQFRPTGGEITVLMTPDKRFLCAKMSWSPWGWADGWIATWWVP
jgi:hypothetical protein